MRCLGFRHPMSWFGASRTVSAVAWNSSTHQDCIGDSLQVISPRLAIYDHADRGLADSESFRQILLERTGFMLESNESHFVFGQFGIGVSTASVRGAIANTVSLVLNRRAVAEVGKSVDQLASGSVSNLLSFGAVSKERTSHKDMNEVMSLGAFTIGQDYLPVLTINFRGVNLPVLPHDASRSDPGVDIPASGSSPDGAIKRTDSSVIRDFVNPFVTVDLMPTFHKVQSSTSLLQDKEIHDERTAPRIH